VQDQVWDRILQHILKILENLYLLKNCNPSSYGKLQGDYRLQSIHPSLSPLAMKTSWIKNRFFLSLLSMTLNIVRRLFCVFIGAHTMIFEITDALARFRMISVANSLIEKDQNFTIKFFYSCRFCINALTEKCILPLSHR
jgi:hypothetical protein